MERPKNNGEIGKIARELSEFSFLHLAYDDFPVCWPIDGQFISSKTNTSSFFKFGREFEANSPRSRSFSNHPCPFEPGRSSTVAPCTLVAACRSPLPRPARTRPRDSWPSPVASDESAFRWSAPRGTGWSLPIASEPCAAEPAVRASAVAAPGSVAGPVAAPQGSRSSPIYAVSRREQLRHDSFSSIFSSSWDFANSNSRTNRARNRSLFRIKFH